MASVRYLGIYQLKLPTSIPIEGSQTVTQTMVPLIKASKMTDDHFWDTHLVLVNGRRPEMDELVVDSDKLDILSYSEGG